MNSCRYQNFLIEIHALFPDKIIKLLKNALACNQKVNGLSSAPHQVSLKPSFCVITNQPANQPTHGENAVGRGNYRLKLKHENDALLPALFTRLRVGRSDILANHELDVIFTCPDLYSSNERLNKHMGVLL